MKYYGKQFIKFCLAQLFMLIQIIRCTSVKVQFKFISLNAYLEARPLQL